MSPPAGGAATPPSPAFAPSPELPQVSVPPGQSVAEPASAPLHQPIVEPPASRSRPEDSAPGPSPAPRRRISQADSGGRPAAGSIRDLLARLDRLPDGHPSSPYEDGGLAKPLPHRLRQLELGLPAPEREPTDFSLAAELAASPALPAEPPPPPVPQPGAADEPPHIEPDAPADEDAAIGAGPADPVPASDSEDPRPRGSSWQDPYARPVQANGHGRPEHGLTEPGLALGPWPGAGHEVTAESPGFHDERRSGDGQPDQSGHARASARGSAEDQAEIVAGLLAAYRTAEGRNRYGDYGERGLTPAMRRIASQLPRGGIVPGSEAEALKSEDRLAAKLARLIARHPGRSPEELATGIGDGIRYAFTFDPDYYTDGTWLVHRKLKAYGFELEARRNRWDSPEYKGVWTRWRDPAHGLLFEVQFHTGVSWDVMQRTHSAFIQITDPETTAAERARLRARQVAAAAIAKAPPHCAEISDFGREAR